MSKISICIDVPDMSKALAFYTGALSFQITNEGKEYSELSVDGVRVFIVEKPPGSNPLLTIEARRNYDRHWTPVHFDIAVENIEATIANIVKLGGAKEGGKNGDWGAIAFCADPFGNGFCITQYNE